MTWHRNYCNVRGGRGTIEERFWKKVCKGCSCPTHDHSKGCYIWIGAVISFPVGYGAISVNSRTVGAHVVAMFLKTGSWPTKLTLHTCDIRLCVNTEHLYEGTRSDNLKDAYRKGVSFGFRAHNGRKQKLLKGQK